MAKKKTVVMSDAELLAPLPTIALAEVPAAKVDFMAQKEFLSVRLDQVLGMEMTEANLERVKALKKGFQGWRTTFEKQTDEYIKQNYKAPMNVFKAAVSEVLAEIQQCEDKVDEVLDKEEQKRIDNLNMLFDGIEEDLKNTYKMPEAFYARVERRKNYYNKTAKMSDVANDLTSQYQELHKEYQAKELAKKQIVSLCSSDKRLNPEHFIEMLEYNDFAVVYNKIDQEKERLAELDKPVSDAEVISKDELPPVVGLKLDASKVTTDFPGLCDRGMTLQIDYSADMADELTRIFSELRKAGVKIKVLAKREPEVPIF